MISDAPDPAAAERAIEGFAAEAVAALCARSSAPAWVTSAVPPVR